MKNELIVSIEKLEKEIQYLYLDYKKMFNQSCAFAEITALILKIKHAEESLRLKKRMLSVALN